MSHSACNDRGHLELTVYVTPAAFTRELIEVSVNNGSVKLLQLVSNQQ